MIRNHPEKDSKAIREVRTKLLNIYWREEWPLRPSSGQDWQLHLLEQTGLFVLNTPAVVEVQGPEQTEPAPRSS